MIATLLAAMLAMVPGNPGAMAAGRESEATPTIAVIEFPGALRFIGLPQDCDTPIPMTPDWVPDPDGEICSNALYEGNATEVRHLSGPRLRNGVRVRLIAHNMDTGVRGRRFLIPAVPFTDGTVRSYYAGQISAPSHGNDYCFDQYDFDRMDPGPFREVVAEGYRRRFDVGVLEKVRHFCVRG